MAIRAHPRAASGTVRRAVLVGLFAGTGVGAGYLLSGAPNWELMTLVAALAGGTIGRSGGVAAGALGAAIYSLGNPLGAPAPPVLAAQAAGMGAAGWLGGTLAPPVLANWRAGRRVAASALALLCGVLATLFYDLLTNLSLALAFGLPPAATLIVALPLAAVHLATNAAQFLLLFPWLLDRFAWRGQEPLRGVLRLAAIGALAGGLAAGGAEAAPRGSEGLPAGEAAVDTLSARTATDATAPPPGALDAAAPDTGRAAPAEPPFWAPFAANLPERLARDSRLVPLIDGGFGARLRLVHEADTGAPLFLRDGIPLGVGHRWADDPWTVSQTGLELAGVGYGADGWGGTGGVIQLARADPEPGVARTDTRFTKGPHGSYLRSLAFRTPRAPWRLRFDFEETIDQQGYDFRPPDFPGLPGMPALGESRFRAGRGTLERLFGGGRELSVSLESVRKHKRGLPSADLRHEELWSDHASADWRSPTAAGALRAALFFSHADVQRQHADQPQVAPQDRRKLEMSREGVLCELAGHAGRRLVAGGWAWRLHDGGAEASWAAGAAGPVEAGGEGAHVSLEQPLRGRAVAATVALAAWWDDHGGWLAGGGLTARPAAGRSWWEATLEAGGRAPRPDELHTADLAAGGGQQVALLPNPDLRRERTWRAALKLSGAAAGTEVALDASARLLRGGIGWRALPEQPDRGRWENGLDLDSWCLALGARRAGRLAGRVEAGADVIWRGHEVRAGVPVGLPPARSDRLRLAWERSLFHGDGVLEIGYLLERRGAMDDPWLPAGRFRLPSHLLHHLLLGFRLVGVDLTMELRNLADAEPRLSTGALGYGRELRWRMEWSFRR